MTFLSDSQKKKRRTFSLPEFAKIMGLCERKVQRLAQEGKIPGQYRKGKRWRIRESSALGKLGTMGSLAVLGKAVGKSLFSSEFKQSLRKAAKAVHSGLSSPRVVAAGIWEQKAALRLGVEPHLLRFHLSEGDVLKLDMPLEEEGTFDKLTEKDIAPFLHPEKTHLIPLIPLISAILATARKQQGRNKPRGRSVGVMTLLAKTKNVSRSKLYRELEDLVPEGQRPATWIQSLLKSLEKHCGTLDEKLDTQTQEHLLDGDAADVEAWTQSFTPPSTPTPLRGGEWS
jgi:Helix-turn-helix domain